MLQLAQAPGIPPAWGFIFTQVVKKPIVHTRFGFEFYARNTLQLFCFSAFTQSQTVEFFYMPFVGLVVWNYKPEFNFF